MTAEAAKARIEGWLAPISDASPAGDDARYEPLHEEIRTEAAKLDSPTTGMPNWDKLVKDAEALTSQTSKDLLIEAYAAYGLYQIEGLQGLAAGIFLLAESMERYWDSMHPAARRLRARVNAISWLTDKLDTTLPETQVGAGDHDAVEALEAAVQELRRVVGDKFEDQAPALRPLSDTVERLKMSLPEREETASDTEPPPPPDNGAGAAQPAPGPAPTPQEAPPAAAPAAAAEPTPPAAAEKTEASPEDLEAELKEKVAQWVEPVPGDAPAGIDAKYEMEHEELRNDIAALDTPTGANLDWAKVVPRAGAILQDKSKDLLIASYMAYGLWETRRLEGLATGLELISELCERYWEDLFPPARRIRGRANALSWFLDRIEGPLPDTPLKADDKHDLDLLEQAVKRFSSVVRDKFEDAAPSIRPLSDNVQRLKMSLPAPEPEAPPPPPPSAEPAPAPKPAAAPAPKPAAAPAANKAPAAVQLGGAPAALADPKEVGKFAKDVAKSLVEASKALREAAPQDPTSYQFIRLALALGTNVPPSQNGATKVPPPQDVVLKDFDVQLSNQNWEGLLQKAEVALVSKRFWLDLHRYSALALTNLGSGYDAAREAVIAGAAYWVKQYPELLDLTFNGGLPFASDLTKEWIQSEVMPSGGGGGGGEAGEGTEVLSEARSLAAGGKLEDALKALEGLAHGARSGRARFRARLSMAQTLSSGNTASVAEGIYDALLSEIDAVGLERWEPDLAAECYRGHLGCLKSLKKGNDPTVSQQTALVYRRLCRVDPLAAVKAG